MTERRFSVSRHRRSGLLGIAIVATSVVTPAMGLLRASADGPQFLPPWVQPPIMGMAAKYFNPQTPPAEVRGTATAPQLPSWQQSWTPFSQTTIGATQSSVRLSAAPMYRPGGPDGAWQPVDATIVPDRNGASVTAAGTLVPTHLATDPSQLIGLDLPKGPVVISAPVMAGGHGSLTVDGVRLSGAPNGLDLAAHVTREGVRLEVTPRMGATASSITFHIADSSQQLGTATTSGPNAIVFGGHLDAATLTMWTGSLRTGDGSHSPSSDPSGAGLTLAPSSTGEDVTVAVPAAGTAGSASSPVVVTLAATPSGTPTSGTLTVAGDGCASACALAETDGLVVSADAGGPEGAIVQRGLVGFDTSVIPSGAVIDGASLSANVRQCLTTPCPVGAQIEVHDVTARWEAATPAATTILATRAQPDASQPLPTAGGRVIWDVTGAVQRWTRTSTTPHGFGLQVSDEASLSGGAILDSATALNPALIPELDVTYHIAVSTTRLTPPPAPTSARVQAGPQSALVTWAAPAMAAGQAPPSFVVTLVDTPAGSTQTVVTDETAAWFFGLRAGDTVSASVWTQTPQGRSSAPAIASASLPTVMPAPLLPSVPIGVTARVGAAGTTVLWHAPAGSTPVSRFDVTSYGPGGTTVATVVTCGACTTAVLGPPQTSVITVGVRAWSNFGGPGAEAQASLPVVAAPPAPSSPTPAAAPPAKVPTNPSTTPTPAASPTPTPAPTSASGSGTVPAVPSSPSPSTAATAATTPADRIQLVSYVDTRPAAVPSLPAAAGPGTPDPPASVQATAGNTTATITWTPPTIALLISSYTVQAYTPGGSPVGPAVTVCGSCLSATVTGLTNGKSYYATVYATNPLGPGSPAYSPIFTLPAPPSITSYLEAPGTFARGGEVEWTIRVSNPQAMQMSVSSLSDTLPTASYLPESFVTLDSTNLATGPFCTAQSTPSCTLDATGHLSIGSFSLDPGTSHTFRYVAIALGSERACATAPRTATAANDYGANTDTQAALICDAGLGVQPWYTTRSWTTGPLGSVVYSAGDDNAVVAQDDSTPVRLHGGLTLGIHRSLNTLASSAASGGSRPLGGSWIFTFDDGGVVASGLTVSGVSVPPDETVGHPLALAVVDAGGGRDVFRLSALPTPIDVSALMASQSTGPLSVTIPRALVLDAGYTSLCVDQVGQGPAGVHASLWRYVEIAPSAASCATPASWTSSAVLGYGLERVDRVRYEFASDGSKLDTQDANANEIRVHYVNDPPSAGKAMGQLASVMEPATQRALTVSQVSSTEVDITDVAHRTTKYKLATAAGPLTEVDNPDGTEVTYAYGCSGGTSTQPCRISAPFVSGGTPATTGLTYTTTSADSTAWAGPPHVLAVTDRRGNTTTVAVTTATGTTTLSMPGVAGQSGQMTVLSAFDAYGSAGEVDVVDPAAPQAVLTQEYAYWDSGGACRQPDGVLDHDLCATLRQTLNGATTADLTSFEYGAEGQLLRSESCTVMSDLSSRNSVRTCGGQVLDTTFAFHSLYVDGSGSAAPYDDAIAAAGQVTSQSGGGTGGARRLRTTLYAMVDPTGSMPPRGNTASPSPSQAAFLTALSLDNNPGVAPNQPLGASVCSTPSAPAGNTGQACQIQSPSYDGVHPTLTQMRYLSTGELASKLTPLAIAMGAAAIQYTYYADSARDLSGTVSAGGWLKATTDQFGNFTALAYDAAGNATRTWDRDATQGHQLGAFPGTVAAPASPSYSEVLHGSGAAAYSAPGRFVVSSRDQLGDLTTYTLDADGNRLTIRPPLGNQGNTANFDTVQTFYPDDLIHTVKKPAETSSQVTSTSYDARGNPISVTDPMGAVMVDVYDSADRKTIHKWTRSAPYTVANAPAAPPACTTSSQADAPIPSGRILCSATTRYDGVGNVTSVTDGDGGWVFSGYDGVRRKTVTAVERSSSPLTWAWTQQVYDEDGNPVRTCPPNTYAAGTTNCATSTSASDTVSTYDVNDRLSSTSTFRAVGSTTQTYTSHYTYDADGNRASSTNPRSVTTTDVHNVLDRKVSESFPRSGATITTQWIYSNAGDVTATIDPAGHVEAKSYDPAHRLLDTVEGADNVVASLAGPPTSDGGSNIRTRYAYDANGNMQVKFLPGAFAAPYSVTNPDNRFRTVTLYDADDRPYVYATTFYDNGDTNYSDTGTGDTDPQQSSQCTVGNTGWNGTSTVGQCFTVYGYDADGRLIVTYLPTGYLAGQYQRNVTKTYTDDGLVASVTKPNPTGSGTATTYDFYDASGRQVQTLDWIGYGDWTAYSPDGLVTEHDGSPLVTCSSTSCQVQAWHCQRFDYDANANRTGVTTYDDINASSGCSNGARRKALTYTSDNFVGSDTDTGGNVTAYVRDQVGNPVQVYSPSANAHAANNPTGTPTSNTYTEDNKLLTSTQPVVASSSNPQLRRTSYTYAPFGNKQTQSVATVDAAGNVIANGGTQTFGYYPDNRLWYTLGRNNEQTVRLYDPAGQLSYVTLGNEAESFAYYLNELPRTAYISWGSQGAIAFQYNYDGSGALTQRHTYGTWGYGTTYTHGDAGQVTSTVDTVLGTWSWSYDADGHPVSQRSPNGPDSLSMGWNTDGTLGQLRTVEPNYPNNGYWWSYDSSYRMTAMFAAGTTANLHLYNVNDALSYDAAGHLSYYQHQFTDYSGSGGGDTLTYNASWDPDGNRLGWGSTNAPTTNRTATYNADDSVATQTTGITASFGGTTTTDNYNPTGTLATDGCLWYAYDGYDQMTATTPVAGNQCGARGTSTYTYDGLHRLVSRTDAPYSLTTLIANDGFSSNVVLQQRINIPTTANRDQYSALDAGGRALGDVFGAAGFAKQEYLTYDGHATVTRVTNASGNPVATPFYDPFGAKVTDLLGGQSVATAIGGADNTVGYRSGQLDRATGTYQFGLRNYDPAKGTFLQPDAFVDDPSGRGDGMLANQSAMANRYGYAGGDPVNYWDPTGHDVCKENPGDCTKDDGSPDLGMMAAQGAMSSQDNSPAQVQAAEDSGNSHNAAAQDRHKAVVRAERTSQARHINRISENQSDGHAYVALGYGAFQTVFDSATGQCFYCDGLRAVGGRNYGWSASLGTWACGQHDAPGTSCDEAHTYAYDWAAGAAQEYTDGVSGHWYANAVRTLTPLALLTPGLALMAGRPALSPISNPFEALGNSVWGVCLGGDIDLEALGLPQASISGCIQFDHGLTHPGLTYTKEWSTTGVGLHVGAGPALIVSDAQTLSDEGGCSAAGGGVVSWGPGGQLEVTHSNTSTTVTAQFDPGYGAGIYGGTSCTYTLGGR